MSSANLEFVRSLYEAWGRGDYSSVDWADPEIEFVGPDGPDRIRTKGVAELAEAWRDFLETWEEWRVEPEEFREIDEERVLVFVKVGGRGRSSGLEVDQMPAAAANLFEIRAGKVRRLTLYWDRELALADVTRTA